MSKSSLNINKQFMIGNGLLAFAVFIIVALFIYLSFRTPKDPSKSISYKGIYNIEIANNFAGDSITIYINDSLILDRIMPNASMQLTINRFAESSTLMVVDNQTDKATPFTLNDEGSHIHISRINGIIYLLETEK